MATPSTRRWSYSEFARLPNDGNRYEVIAGELCVTPAPTTPHQRIIGNLYYLLRGFVDEHDLGSVWLSPVDVLLAEGDYLEPDLVFVRREREGIISERGIEATPDLVIEVLSESTAERDRGLKRERYAYFGVPQYWIVDPGSRTVLVYQLSVDPHTPRQVHEVLEAQLVPGSPVLSL
ncbi:MAG: Uma2 family endonuclease, partial [Gemmatimonadetes bacterium]|nr:Uma2 family endonuclease [Gemmatimonadota bacterium]